MTRSNLPEGDDGHVIADMNVEGMPWYKPEKPVPEAPKSPFQEKLDKRQTRMYTMGALRAGLTIAGVMILGLFLFLLFCLYVWFRV